jgi:hypothetical protein
MCGLDSVANLTEAQITVASQCTNFVCTPAGVRNESYALIPEIVETSHGHALIKTSVHKDMFE